MSDPPAARGGLVDAIARLFADLSQRTALLFIVGFIALGSMMTVALPAFQVPDENAHWWVGLRRASAVFGGSATGVCGAAVELPYYLQFDRMRWKNHEPMQLGLARGLDRVPGVCTSHSIPYGIATSYPSVLLGYPFFFSAAQRSGAAATHYFYFARLMAGFMLVFFFWRVARAFALRGPTPGLATMAAFFWSPLFVQQGFAVTSDTSVILFALSIVTLCLRMPSVPRFDLALFIISGVTAIWTKPTIVPVALVPVLWILASHLPGVPWRGANLRAAWARLGRNRQSVTILFISLALVLSAFVAFVWMGGGRGVSTLDGARSPSTQMTHVQQHLSSSLGIFVASVTANIKLSALNGLLGWLDTPLPNTQYFVWRRLVYGAILLDSLFVLVVLVQGGPRGWLRRVAAWLSTGAGVLVGSAASMAAVALAMYVTTTNVAAGSIEGVQPRYFFPSILVAAMAFCASRLVPAPWPCPRDEPPRWVRPAAAILTWAVSVHLVFAFVGIFARLYLALWTRYW